MRLRIVLGVLTAMLLAAMDQTIVAPAIPTIGAELGHADWLAWIVSAYFLTATAVTPLYGKLADIHGRRSVLFAGIGIFLAGSVICAMAPSMLLLVIGRAVQGLGGGGLMALAQTVIGDLVPPKERGRFVVYISGTWAIATIAGPVLGGFLTEHWHWRVIFWLNLPIAALAIAMVWRPLGAIAWPRRPHRLDFAGSALIVSATVALLLALTWGGASYPWGSPLILALIATALLLAIVLAVHLIRAEEPLLPPDILANPVVLTASLSVFFAMAAYVGLAVELPIYLQLVHGLGSSDAGLVLVAYMAGTVAGANTAARLMQRVARYKRLPVWGLVIAALCMVVFALFADRLAVSAVVVLVVLVGLGSGAQFPVTTVSVQNAVDPRDLGVATGALGFLRSLGSAIGVAVMGAIATAGGVVLAPGGRGLEFGAAGAAAGLPIQSGAVFMPVFLAIAASLFCAFACLSLMEEKPLRGRDELRPPEAGE